jgi:hypothetical protein
VFDVRCGSKRKWRHARMRSAFTSAMDTENAQRRLWNIVSCESAFLPKADVKYNAHVCYVPEGDIAVQTHERGRQLRRPQEKGCFHFAQQVSKANLLNPRAQSNAAYGVAPSTAKMRNVAYLSPMVCEFLRPGESHHACALSMLSN